MPGIEDLADARTFAMGHGVTRELIVARKRDTDDTHPSFNFGEVPIHHPIPNDIQQLVVHRLEKRIDQIRKGKKDLVEYELSNVNREDTPVQHLSRHNFPMYDTMEELLTETEFPDSSYEKPRPDFQVIRIRDRRGRVLLAFRQYTNRQYMGLDKKAWIFLQDNEYSKIEQEEVISLPNKIDAVYYDDVFYVFKQSNFEDIFDWVQELEDQAHEVFDTIEANDVLVHDMGEFRTRVFNHRTKMRKLYEVSQNGIVEDLDMDTAKRIIHEFDLDLTITENEDGEEGIEIPNGHKVWDVIRLFNNDHLVSPVDSSRFQVFGKDKRN